ncbi:hypothetical protein AAFF_G00228700 [Aldrovandia affinis]|uniref:Uncharacterized protein n=1 Tax=Aldrovandia affinis TaxID=143900 RepID=A0AAD7WV61_9TELE|nr:hypothetical protein AAFF_G00228700 [Aldrovandia affinis]
MGTPSASSVWATAMHMPACLHGHPALIAQSSPQQREIRLAYFKERMSLCDVMVAFESVDSDDAMSQKQPLIPTEMAHCPAPPLFWRDRQSGPPG